MKFSFMRQDVQVRERMAAAEQQISFLKDSVRPLETDAQVSRKALSEHTAKMADMEDCMRRNNIRLVGFPEGAEGRILKISWNVGFRQIWNLVPLPDCLPLNALIIFLLRHHRRFCIR